MSKPSNGKAALLQENAELRAIHASEVDALVVADPQGPKVFTLKSVDRLYRILFETISEGALTLATDGTILYCNRHFANMVESPLNDILGCAFQKFIAPADQEMTETLLKLKTGAPRPQAAVSLVTAQNKILRVHLSANLFSDDGMQAIALVVTDISAQLRDAAEISRLNSDLEERIRARTAELEDTNKELESFSYSVSHDLRAPLRHMQGFGELLKKSAVDKLDETGRRHIETILDSAREMSVLIDDLLAFSHIGRVERRVETIDLNDLVREAVGALSREAQTPLSTGASSHCPGSRETGRCYGWSWQTSFPTRSNSLAPGHRPRSRSARWTTSRARSRCLSGTTASVSTCATSTNYSACFNRCTGPPISKARA